ncbi:MAG: hypothetical protein WB902_20235 [Acetobacteraceae bacterium]|jgi:hypothetical protein
MPEAETVRLHSRWYAPFSNGICLFSVIILVVPALVRLSFPPSGQSFLTPITMLVGGLVFPVWHFHAACSSRTFLEMSRDGFWRSVCGQVRFYRWDAVSQFLFDQRIFGPASIWTELQPHGKRLVIDVDTGFRPGFQFGGLGRGRLAAALNAWRTRAISGGLEPMPGPTDAERSGATAAKRRMPTSPH